MKLVPLALTAAAVILVASGAQAKTITEVCKKNLATNEFFYDVSTFSEDDIIKIVRFRETSRDSRFATASAPSI